MRALLIGATGMLGSDLKSELQAQGHTVIAPRRQELDVTDASSVAKIPAGDFGELDFCFNCSAFTAVDKAESEAQAAAELNAIGPGYLANACQLAGVRLIHISTDFVFDGSKREPYVESDRTNPLGMYGRSKLDGELAVLENAPNSLVVRTSWLYGPNGNSFPKTMIRAWNAQKPLRVVGDQYGTPTYTGDLSKLLVQLAELNPESGIYHGAGPDVMSWHDFATMAIATYELGHASDRAVEIASIKTSDWPTPAIRPPYSALGSERLPNLHVSLMRSTALAVKEFVARLPDIF